MAEKKKARRGRPPKDNPMERLVTVRMDDEMSARVEAHRKKAGLPDISAAVRDLIRLALWK